MPEFMRSRCGLGPTDTYTKGRFETLRDAIYNMTMATLTDGPAKPAPNGPTELVHAPDNGL
jgi:hypothetical protein